jgi:hypothetical protein
MELYRMCHLLCNARSKRSGETCRAFAMANGKCYHHGGVSTGPRTEEGRRRNGLLHTKTGKGTNAAKAERLRVRQLYQETRACLADAKSSLEEAEREKE